jgi:hypothetical protein
MNFKSLIYSKRKLSKPMLFKYLGYNGDLRTCKGKCDKKFRLKGFHWMDREKVLFNTFFIEVILLAGSLKGGVI